MIDHARTRVLAFLNILGAGMHGVELEQDVSDMDAKAAAELAIANRGTIVGIKVAHYLGPDWTPVERGVEAGTRANIPVMVDFGRFRPERPFRDLVLHKLRPGDIYTHMYLGQVPMLDEKDRLLPYLPEARKRGVVFDVGHGAASLLFRQAAPAMRQGFPPDSISTDIHADSITAGMKDMLNVMSKFLVMGMPLEGVVLRSTWNPAHEIRREDLGHLSVGTPADVAVLRVETGDFGYVDAWGARMPGDRRLVCELTIFNGIVVYDLNGITWKNWDKLGHYPPQGERWWDETVDIKRH